MILNQPDATTKRQNRITLASFVLLLTILLVATFTMVAPYLLAVVMGSILAVLFRRFYTFLCTKKFAPKIAAGVVTVSVGLLIVVPVFIFSLLAVTQAIEVAQDLSKQPDLNLGALSERASHIKILKNVLGDAGAVQQELKNGIKALASVAPGVIFKFFGGMPEFVLQVMLGLLSCYFFLLDGTRFVVWLRNKIPLDPEVRGTITDSFRETAFAAIVSTITAATVQTGIVVTGFLLLGVPAPFLAGGLTFIMAWVPIIGSSPVWIGAAIYLFLNSTVLAGCLMLGVGVLTGLSDNIVYPMVLRGKGEMHPLVSLVAIFGGIQFFGIFGVFIGPIMAALLISTMNIWPILAERYGILRSAHLVTAAESNVPPPPPSL